MPKSNQLKPRRRTPEPSITVLEELTTDPAVSLPSNLAATILWSPPFQEPMNVSDISSSGSSSGSPATIQTLRPAFHFPDGIFSEVRAETMYAFSQSVQLASVGADKDDSLPNGNNQTANSLPEPVISLYYPHEGCHEILDSMVKSLAMEQGADIVVLDSLQLALGEFGAFGKGAIAF
jgi:hypothetical protein